MSVSLSSKLPSVGTSIFATMSKMANDNGAMNLSQGFPDFDTSPELTKLVYKYMKKGCNQYAPMPGIIELREQLALKAQKLYGTTVNPETEITITAGATQAIYAAITAVVQEGDEVIIFEPCYDSYVPAINLSGGNPIPIQLEYPDYTINWAAVRQRISLRTKMIIINNPNNPTGTVLSEADLKELDSITRDTDIIVLSDEVYEHITFDGKLHESALKYPELFSRSFVTFSFGKTYHNTGWKMGYCIAPEILTEEFRKVHQFLVFSANTPIQYALAEYLKDASAYAVLPSFFQKKRDIFLDVISSSNFNVTPSSGTYFQLLNYEKMTTKDDVDVARILTEKSKIASIPVSVFYSRGNDQKVLRFCFAKSEETLVKAGQILCKIK